MRKVLMLTAVAGADFSWTPNQVIEMPDEQAAVWADGERGRYLEPSDFMEVTERDFEALNTRLIEEAEQQVLDREGTPAYVHRLLDAWATGEPLDFAGHPVPEDVQARVVEVLRETTTRPPAETPERPARETTVPQTPETPEDPPPRSGAGSGREPWAAYATRHQVQVTADMRREDVIAACEAAGVATDRAVDRPADEEGDDF